MGLDLVVLLAGTDGEVSACVSVIQLREANKELNRTNTELREQVKSLQKEVKSLVDFPKTAPCVSRVAKALHQDGGHKLCLNRLSQSDLSQLEQLMVRLLFEAPCDANDKEVRDSAVADLCSSLGRLLVYEPS